MCGGSKNPTTTTSQSQTSSPDPNAYAAYLNVLNRAQGAGSQPYTPYGGELVAGVNGQQNAGISGINANANAAQPAFGTALTQAQTSSAPLSQAAIQQYMSPYTQNVVNATQAQFDNQNQQQQQSLTGNAIAQGALGGNRVGVAQANLAGQQQTAQAPVIAGLYNQGYGQAVNTAEQQQQTGLQGANLTGQLGVGMQNAGLQGAQAQIGAGGLLQNTQQAQDTANYGQFQNQQAYPYQQLSWLAGLDTGVGSNMGGTGTGTGQTVGPAPNPWSQILGGATTAASLFAMSDKRMKENIQSIGKLNNGQTIYRFNFKGDPATHIGLMAQNEQKAHPDAVHSVNGILHVDYKKATDDAVKRAAGGVVPHFDTGGSAYPGAFNPFGPTAGSYIPGQQIVHGSGPPKVSPPSQGGQSQPDPSKEAAQIGSIAKSLMNFGNPGTPGTAIPGAEGPTSYGGPNGPTPLVGVGTGIDPSNFDLSGLSIYARGGGVRGYDDGGVVPLPRPDPREGSADVRSAYEDIRGTPPVTVMEDVVGRFSPSKAQDNAVRDAIRQRAFDTIKMHPDVSDPVSAYERGRYARGGVAGVRGYEAGGDPVPSYDDDTGVAPPDDTSVFRMPDADAVQKWRDGVDADMGLGQTAQAVAKTPTPPTPPTTADVPVSARSADGVAPATRAMGYSDEASSPTDNTPPEVSLGYSPSKKAQAQGVAPSSPPDDGGQTPVSSSRFGPDSKLWPALLSAGLGMMSSRSPYFGNAVGAGGEAGLATYSQLVKDEYQKQQDAKKFDFEQQKFNRPYNELTADQKAVLARQKAQDAITQANQPIIIDPKTGQPMRNPISAQIKEEDKIPFGWEQKDDGTIAPVKGGPQDTAYQRDVAAAKRLPGMSDDALADMAKAYRQGFTGVIQQIARGTSGPDNLNRFWNTMEQQLKEEGLTGRDLASAKANFQAQSAAAVTAARREANVESNVVEAQKTFPLALEASANLPRSNWTDWNKLKQMYNERTSSPEQARFFTATQGVITTYAQAMARAGVATVDGRHAAEALLSTVTGPEAYEAVIRQMEKEMQAAVEAPDVVRQHILDRISGRPSAAPAAGAPAQPRRLPPSLHNYPPGISRLWSGLKQTRATPALLR